MSKWGLAVSRPVREYVMRTPQANVFTRGGGGGVVASIRAARSRARPPHKNALEILVRRPTHIGRDPGRECGGFWVERFAITGKKTPGGSRDTRDTYGTRGRTRVLGPVSPLSMQAEPTVHADPRPEAPGRLTGPFFSLRAFGLDRPRRRVRAWLVPPRQVHALQHQRPRRRSGRGGRAAGARCSGNVHATLSVKTNAQGCARRGTLPPIAPTAVPRASPYVPGVCGRPSASSRRRDGQRRFAMRFAEYQVPQYQSMESSQKLSGESERRLVGFRSSMGCALVRSAL